MDPSLPKAAGCLKRKRSLSDAADPDLEDGSSWKENNGGNSSSATTVLAAHGQGSGAVDPGHEFHVFLSFRGPDIRKTFADVLYHKLIDVGVHTFLDSEKLHVGKQIGPELMRAIKQSKICIPIFTKYYASSKWCLREVTEMMKLRENPEREIIPIFIDVTPDEVQHQSGSYKEAFTQHEKNLELDPATVREWRDALKEVLSLKGLELKIEADGKYGKFAHLVAAEVLRKLRRAWKLNEGDNLVGLDHPVKVVMQLLDKGRMVGIWGAGGIGKTTLAKNVYNQIANGFECCCFLGDIRENSKNGGLLKLQEKLVSQLLGQQNHHFTSTDEGIDVLKYRVRGKKALILLDDVDAIDQIEALSADPRWFGEGSRILITARDQGVLKYFTWCKIYDHKPLDKHQARELFSKYAFRDDSPSTEFADLSKEIVDIIGRLPLTLKTTGSTLFTFGGKKDIWEDAKNKLKKGEPLNDDVRKKLMISYEYLDDKQKNIFLDIVCFFIGKDYRTVIPVWRHCSMSPKLEIEVLQYKSLIKIDDENIIQMHDELRDLGRHIVDQQGRKPEQRSRLWRNREVIDMLRGHKETKHIEGALISEVKTREILHGECFKNLSKLKILMVNGDVSLDQNCEHLLPNLRWLTWSNNKRYLPSNLHLQKLVVLDLSGCISLDDHWGGWKTIKSGSLESLIIDGTRVRELPISAQMKNLEFLSANYCRELVRIPESIGSLVKLKRLSLEWCKRLKTLPKTIGRLSSLTELQLCGCGFRWLPKSIENLTNLEVMDARHSYYLHGEVPVEIGSHAHSKFLTIFLTKDDMLPDGISKFKKLEVLYLYLGEHWTQLDLPKLPSSLRRLIVTSVGGLFFDPWKITDSEYMDQVELEENSYKLEFLRMENVNITALTEGMSSFTRLKEVQIAGCKMLRCLPTLPSDLRSLTVSDCPHLRNFSDLSNLKLLLRLDISGCHRLISIDGLGDLVSLKELEISWCRRLGKLTVSDKIVDLIFLKKLKISWCGNIEILPKTLRLRNLKELNLISCDKLTGLDGIVDLVFLKVLEISKCGNIEHLAKKLRLTSLEELKLISCDKLTGLDGIVDLVSLKVLEISKCGNIEYLAKTLRLTSLEELKLINCDKLTVLDGIVDLVSLKVLEISKCGNIENLAKTLRLTSLEKLKLINCDKLTGIDGIVDLVSLKVLEISKCGNIKYLSKILRLASLEELKLFDCEKLIELDGIVDLVSLKVLKICGCENIEHLPKTLKLMSLEKLKLSNCKKLTGKGVVIFGITKRNEYLVPLKELKINRCNIKNLSKILNLNGLFDCEKLIITKGWNIKYLPKILNRNRLKILNLNSCNKLTKLGKIADLKINGSGNIKILPKSLVKLELFNCEKLTGLNEIKYFVSLKILIIYMCRNIADLSILKWTSIEKLSLFYCEKLTELNGIIDLISLKELTMGECSNIEYLSKTLRLTNLKKLKLAYCDKLTKLGGIIDLISLKKLSCINIKHLSKILRATSLEKLTSLKELNIMECKNIKDLPNRLISLEKLSLCNCDKLIGMDGIIDLISLKFLSIKYCPAIEKLPDMSQLKKLESLVIWCCDKLKQLDWHEMRSLQYLFLFRCKLLERLSDLGRLQLLKGFNMEKCENIKILPGIDKLNKNVWIRIISCHPDLDKKSSYTSKDLGSFRDIISDDSKSSDDGVEDLEDWEESWDDREEDLEEWEESWDDREEDLEDWEESWDDREEDLEDGED